MKYTVFIRQAEGGKDSRLFCNDLLAAYLRLASAMRWPVT
jgi:protein subunit release factor A